MRSIRKENPNVKYYQIPGKSQLPNPKNWIVLGFGICLVVLVCIWIWDLQEEGGDKW